MKNRVVWRSLVVVGACLSLLGAQHAASPQSAMPGAALTPQDSALHALNRLAYGPRPGDVPRVAAEGVMRWIDHQLSPDRIDDDRLAQRERRFDILRYDRGDLAALYTAAQRERRERKLAAGQTAQDSDSVGAQHAAPLPRLPDPMMLRNRRLASEFADLAVVRATLSERQLYEVMVDFWTNHFNVYAAKGADRFLAPDYIERTIRPRAMGKFEDLLIATARSPAMLFYLDNWESVAPGASPPVPLSARRRGGQGVRRMPKGINENYARELLELHTLGVDGGYTQQDIIEGARIFTGWSIEPPERGSGFVFRDWAHDHGTKHVFGLTFQDDGKDEGIRLLKFLANQHATMHHVSAKLCARFVADEPPDGCVDAAVAAWQTSRGDMRAVLRAIFTSPDFWTSQAVGSKVKTPFEFVVSALRATAIEPDDTPRLAQLVEPLYQQPAPTGYAETEVHWVNSGALLARMNAAMMLAKECASIPNIDDHAQLVDVIDQKLLAGRMSAHTKSVILEQLADVTDPTQARALAVGLALGGQTFKSNDDLETHLRTIRRPG